MLFAKWVELFCGLCRNHIVMPMKIKRTPSASESGQQRDWRLAVLHFQADRRKSLAVEIQFTYAPFKQVRASGVTCSGRILCRNSNELRHKRGHFLLAPVQPEKNRVRS